MGKLYPVPGTRYPTRYLTWSVYPYRDYKKFLR